MDQFEFPRRDKSSSNSSSQSVSATASSGQQQSVYPNQLQYSNASSTSLSNVTTTATPSTNPSGRRLLHGSSDSNSTTASTSFQQVQNTIPQSSTPGVYPEPAVTSILQTVFTNFVHGADDKLNDLLFQNLDKDEDLAVYVKENADEDFDRLMKSLGSIAKHSPKLVIDSIMIWRKSKSDPTYPTVIPDDIRNQYSNLKSKDLEAIVKERKSLVSNFILCRGLIEILQHLDKGTLPQELGEKMEDMIFGQLRNVDADLNVRFANRQANTDFFSQLAGALSRIRFSTVSDRFIAEIGKIDVSKGSNAAKETKLEILIRCMRYLKLTVYPMDALEETAEFLAVCAEIFQNSHSIRIKHAYCHVFIDLLEPIAAVASAEVNLPTWQQTVELIYSKTLKMLSKPRHYQVAIPLLTTLLCVSKQDFFLRNWVAFCDNLLQKLKDKTLKHIALSCLCRLVWVYLFRCSEPESTAQRRLETILRVLFPPGKKPIFPSDCHNVMFTHIVYFVLVKYSEFGCQILLPYLLGQPVESSLMSTVSGTGTVSTGTERLFSLTSLQSIEDISVSSSRQSDIFTDFNFGSERLLIAIESFLHFLSDVETALGSETDEDALTGAAISAIKTETAFVVVEAKLNLSAPPFPSFRLDAYMDTGKEMTDLAESKMMSALKEIQNSHIPPSLFNRLSQNIRKLLATFSDILSRVYLLFEASNGMLSLTDSSTLAHLGNSLHVGSSQDTRPISRRSSGANQGESIHSSINESARQLMNTILSGMSDKISSECLCQVLESLPRIVPKGLSASHIIEYVSRCVFHVDENVRCSASNALVRIASINERKIPNRFWSLESPLHSVAAEVTQIFSDTAFQLVGSKFVDISAINPLHELTSELFISSYMNLLAVVLKDLTNLDADLARPLTEYQLDCILDEIESRGILLLCTSISSVRQSGMEILKMAAKFEAALSHQTKNRRWGNSTKDDASSSNTLARLTKLRGSTLTTIKRKSSKSGSQTSTVGRSSRVIHLLREGGIELIQRYAPSQDMMVIVPGPDGYRSLTVSELTLDRDCLIMIGCANGEAETNLWNRCFPHLIHYLFHNVRHEAMESCLVDVLARLQVFHPTIVYSTDMLPNGRTPSHSSGKWMNSSSTSLNEKKTLANPSSTSNTVTSGSGYERIFEQWRQYLIFCTICMDAHQDGNGQLGAIPSQNNVGQESLGIWRSHSLIKRDKKMQSQPQSIDVETFAYDSLQNICRSVLPFLSCDRVTVRNAAVVALGNISTEHYGVLVEQIILHLQSATQDMRERLVNRADIMGGKRPSQGAFQPLRARKLNRTRMELTRLLAIISDFILDPTIRSASHGYTKSIVEFISVSVDFLSDPDVQTELEHQMFRYYFCGFVDRLYSNLAEALGEDISADGHSSTIESGEETPEQYISVSLRVRLFDLFESWSGFSSRQDHIQKRDQTIITSVLEPIKDVRERAKVNEIIEEQRQALENAALKAMAAVCKGVLTDPRVPSIAFDRKRILVWNDALLASQQPKVRAVARSALHSLLRFNFHDEVLFEEMLWRCWDDTESFSNHVYFNSFVDFISKLKKIEISPAKVVSLALFQMGNRRSQMRRCAARLLVAIDRHLLGFDLHTSGLAASIMDIYYDEYRNQNFVQGYDDETTGNRKDAERKPLNEEEGDDQHGDDEFLKEVLTTYETSAITSSLPIVYRYAQRTISARLAQEQPQLTIEMLSELARRTNRLVPTRVLSDVVFRDLLDVMTPWVANVKIATNFRLSKLNVEDPEDVQKACPTFMILNNLLYLTIRLGDIHITEMEGLWQQLVNPYLPLAPSLTSDNVEGEAIRTLSEEEIRGRMATIVDFILTVGVMKQNLHMITHLKKIAIYVCRTKGCSAFIDTIMSLLTPSSIAPPSSEDIKDLNFKMWQIRGAFYLFSLEDVMPTQTERPVISMGQLAFTLLVDATIEIPSFTFRPHLPVILHLIIVQLDHFLRVFCEQSRTLLVNLIQAVLPRESAKERIDATLTALHLKEGKRLWAYEDAIPGEPEPRSVEQLCALSLELVELFSAVHPTLNQAWGELALYWGSTCPIRHLAARSLQMFRAFRPIFHRRMLGDVLSRLSVTMCDPSPEVQGFAYELLLTTECMLQSIETGLFLAFPQFFWVSMVLLQSGLEWEFEKGLQLLDKIMVCLLLEDNIWPLKLSSAFPTRWKGDFVGIQPLLLKGLESIHTEALTIKLLDKVISIEEPKLVNPSSSRLMLSILATVPILLEQFSQHDYSFGLSSQTIAESLQIELAKAKFDDLARLYDSYAKHKFRLKSEFIRQLVALLKSTFFPVYEEKALLLCMSMLRNPREGFRRCVLEFLKQLFPDMRSAGTSNSSPSLRKMLLNEKEWVMPLVSLLNTSFSEDAAEVLDAIMKDKIRRDETDLRFVFGTKSMRTIADENPSNQTNFNLNRKPSASDQSKTRSFIGETKRSSSQRFVARTDSLSVRSGVHPFSAMQRLSAQQKPSDSVSDSGWCVHHLENATKMCRYNMSAVALTCTGGQGIFSTRSLPTNQKIHHASQGPKTSMNDNKVSNSKSRVSHNLTETYSHVDNSDLKMLLPVLDELETFFISLEPPSPPPKFH